MSRRRALLLAGVGLVLAPAPALAVSGSDTMIVVAGNGTQASTGDGGPATSASLFRPRSAAADAAGNVILVQRTSSVARRVGTDGIITRIAGSYASAGFAGDGGPAIDAQLNGPSGVVVDGAGTIYIADEINGRIRKIDPGGTISSLAAGIAAPLGIAVDAAANVYVAEWGNHRVLRISPTGAITIIAGTGTPGYNGDGIPATAAQLNAPGGVAVDSAGNVLIADTGRTRRINAATGIISTIAGNGTAGFAGDGGPATAAQVQNSGVAVDRAGNIYLAEGGGNRVRKIDRNGVISTIAGNGTAGFTATPGPAQNALLSTPFGVSVDATGSLLIGDEGSSSIRRIQNVLPAPAFAISAASGAAPLGIAVDGSPSSGVNDGIIAYAWDFGDGATATGPTAQHTYSAAGSFTVALSVMDESGGTATTTQQIVVTSGAGSGGLALRSATFAPKWRASRLRGSLVLTGNVARTARLQAQVLRANGRGKPLLARGFRVAKAGAFTARLRLAPLLPGLYRIRVRDVGLTAPKLATVDRLATLAAPKEGVVSRALISTALGGRARRSIAAGPGIIFASFRFAALPQRRQPLRVSWYWSGAPGAVERDPKSRIRLVTAFLRSRRGALRTGSYRAELTAGGKLVAVARLRIR